MRVVVGGSAVVVATVAAAAGVLAGCARPGDAGGHRDGRLEIVAAESAWGSLAAQLAGPRARVRSIIASPAEDPHDYEPTAGDARAMAAADLVLVNGLGYDPWAPRLLAANSTPRLRRLNVGELLGLAQGANPHRWYDPADVEAVATALTARLTVLDPAGAAAFAAYHRAFVARGLRRYHALIATIRARFAGAAVGASESIFGPLAAALGLRLLTPTALMNAVAEGNEATAAALGEAEQQIQRGQLRAWIFNPQNDTPAVQRLTTLARARGVPVLAFTETPDPAGTTFEAWQSRQLAGLRAALEHRD